MRIFGRLLAKYADRQLRVQLERTRAQYEELHERFEKVSGRLGRIRTLILCPEETDIIEYAEELSADIRDGFLRSRALETIDRVTKEGWLHRFLGNVPPEKRSEYVAEASAAYSSRAFQDVVSGIIEAAREDATTKAASYLEVILQRGHLSGVDMVIEGMRRLHNEHINNIAGAGRLEDFKNDPERRFSPTGSGL